MFAKNCALSWESRWIIRYKQSAMLSSIKAMYSSDFEVGLVWAYTRAMSVSSSANINAKTSSLCLFCGTLATTGKLIGVKIISPALIRCDVLLVLSLT